jgi:hypothetical protein
MVLIKRLIKIIDPRNIHRQQGGEIFVLTLIILVLASLLLVPLADYINTGIKTTQGYQGNVKRIYAADSGIQYALWKIKYDPIIISDRQNNNFGQTYSYTVPMVNNNHVSVTIAYTWLLSGIINLTNGSYPHDTWLGMDVSGNANPTAYTTPVPHSVYSINFAYAGSGNKKIAAMGVWLPPGFAYLAGSCSSSKYPNNVCFSDPTITSVYGGSSLVWNALNFSFQQLNPPFASQQFWYQPIGTTPKGAASWVESQSSDIGYSWDNAIWWYNATSTAWDSSVFPQKTTTINSLIISDPATSSGLDLVTYVLGQ